MDPIFTFSDQTFILPQYDEQGRAFVEARVRFNLLSFYSYSRAYDLYGPVFNAFDGSRSITRASGRGLGPGNREFLGPVKWHRADREVASGVVVRTGFGIEPAEDLCGVEASSPTEPGLLFGVAVAASTAAAGRDWSQIGQGQ
jgi:hypothetical protein